jgi:cysteine desulfurase/selenocysteine lyase
VQNASAAMNLIAARLRGEGDVLLVRGDFPSVTYPWMAGGHGVSFAEPGEGGGATDAALAAACTPETRILALGLVHYRSGFRYDLEALGQFCRERDLLLVIDATQGLGAVQVDLSAGHADFMVSSGYKWLNSGYGFGVLYGARKHMQPAAHTAAGWRSARDPYALVSDRLDLSDRAAALELGHPPFAAIFGLGAALVMQREIGHVAIENRVLQLAARMRQIVIDAGLRVAPDDAGDLRSGIVYAESEMAGVQLRDELLGQDVYVSARGDGIRCSAHYYNDEDDLDSLAAGLGAVL